MKERVDRATQWVYQGLWGVLTRWFKVPDRPPSLPAGSGEMAQSFRPAEGFLRYLKLKFWVILLLMDGAILAGWIVLMAFAPLVGLMAAPVALAVAVVPDILAYVAIHLRYDTTWYVMTSRSLRIRRGIWVIREMTFTFENVQNVSVTQGPIQRYFGIANVLVETAGGGGAGQQAKGQRSTPAHHGLIEGVANAQQIRDLILKRLQRSRSSGLGDDEEVSVPAQSAWSDEHLDLLRQIRDAAREGIHGGAP